MSTTAEKPKPFLLPEFCKGCGRCIEACAKHCIEMGTEINPQTGLVPVVLHLENCSACGLCMTACPEPYGLAPEVTSDFELQDPAKLFGARKTRAAKPAAIPDEVLALPATQPLVTKGTYASSIGALLAGCVDYLREPWTAEELSLRAHAALERARSRFSCPWGELRLEGFELCLEGKGACGAGGGG